MNFFFYKNLVTTYILFYPKLNLRIEREGGGGQYMHNANTINVQICLFFYV